MRTYWLPHWKGWSQTIIAIKCLLTAQWWKSNSFCQPLHQIWGNVIRSATTWANLWLFEFLEHFSMSVGEMFLVTLAPSVFLGLKSSLTDGPYGLSFTGGCVSQLVPYIAPSCSCLAKTWTFKQGHVCLQTCFSSGHHEKKTSAREETAHTPCLQKLYNSRLVKTRRYLKCLNAASHFQRRKHLPSISVTGNTEQGKIREEAVTNYSNWPLHLRSPWH